MKMEILKRLHEQGLQQVNDLTVKLGQRVRVYAIHNKQKYSAILIYWGGWSYLKDWSEL